MPYTHKYKTRSRSYRRRNYRKRPNPVGQLARKVNKLAGLVKPEFGILQINSAAGATPSTTATLVHLNPLGQDDTSTGRTGDQVFFKSIQLVLRISQNPSATATTCRAMVIVDRSPQGAAFTSGNVLDTTGSMLLVDCFRQQDYRRRFTILFDRIIRLDSYGTKERAIRMFKRLNIKSEYGLAANGNIGDMSTNSIYLLLVSDEAVNTPTIVYNSRLRYLD